jgi:hypothetical protein
MHTNKIIAALAIAAAAITLLAGCGSSHPPDPATAATNTCQELATATSVVNLLNPDPAGSILSGQPLNLKIWAAMVVDVRGEQPSLPQPLRSDLQPLLYGTSTTQTEVAKVSADCTTYGVAAAIWPQFMTTAG